MQRIFTVEKFPAFTYILICLLSYPPKKVYLKKVFLNALVQCTKNILSISRYVSVCLLPSHLDLAELDGEALELCPFFYVYVLALKKCSASSTLYFNSRHFVQKYLYIKLTFFLHIFRVGWIQNFMDINNSKHIFSKSTFLTKLRLLAYCVLYIWETSSKQWRDV